MKRLFLVLALLLIPTMMVFAAQTVRIVDEKDRSVESRQLKSVSVNTATGAPYTLVSTSTIVPGRTRILGYSIHGNATLLATLYDDDAVSIGRGLFINESEVTSTEQRPIWFPSPIKVDYGLVVYCDGGATTRDVVIYYLSD